MSASASICEVETFRVLPIVDNRTLMQTVFLAKVHAGICERNTFNARFLSHGRQGVVGCIYRGYSWAPGLPRLPRIRPLRKPEQVHDGRDAVGKMQAEQRRVGGAVSLVLQMYVGVNQARH